MNKKHSNKVKHLDELVKHIESSISEAEKFAKRNNLDFSLYTAYGMGGTYSEGEWHPSSESC